MTSIALKKVLVLFLYLGGVIFRWSVLANTFLGWIDKNIGSEVF